MPAQSTGSHNADGEDEVRAVVVVARHGIRAPIESETRDSAYNAQPWPAWPVEAGLVTPHGAEALRLVGQFYRLRYASLLEHLSCTHPGLYVEANTVPRTIASAKAVLSGLRPECEVEVHVRPGRNPLFTPAERGVDAQRLNDAILGRMGNRPDWYASTYERQLEKMHEVLSTCRGAAPCDAAKPDFRDTRDGRVQGAPYETAVTLAADFAENFLLEYTEGLPMQQVGWGRVSRADLNDLMELNTRYHDFMLRTPYYSQIAASDLAAHIRDTLLRAATGRARAGQLGAAGDRFVLLDGHDANLTWLGGLLRLDWALPDEPLNATPPGSALIFELHRSRATGAQTVRVLFVSQTLDQMRQLRAADRPSIAPVYVPGCSGPAPEFACAIDDFARVVGASADLQFVEASGR